MPAPTLLAAIPEIARFGYGMFQDVKANQAAKQIERPEFKIPEANKEALQLSRVMAGIRSIPGLDGGDGERLLADTVRGLKSIGTVETGDVAKAAADLKKNQGDQLSQFINGNTFHLIDALTGFGSLQAEAFAWNQQAKYQEEINAVSSISDAANKNMFTALSNASTIGLEKMTQDSWMNFFDDYYDKPMAKPPLVGDAKESSTGVGITLPENRGPGLGFQRTAQSQQELPSITDSRVTEDFVPAFGDFKFGLPDQMGGTKYGVTKEKQGPTNLYDIFDPTKMMMNTGLETVNPISIY
ncbi:MAG TPA: hypothetical protein DCG24_02420 [Bacteroidetes bacterium]|nr:hypothetical protein [Chitinophagales bacterium]HAE13054.1 hypothetical protein [Bacteroidota bacterium]HAE35870.1 hypothetical protein [Bacteroidota bacterium]HQU38958.1 hypothetical protein [Chitinophagales bacterium]HQU76520.1 hypothetical protein [Chitinophagales bacterium]